MSDDCTMYAAGTRKHKLCSGTAGVSLDKTNAYRKIAGLHPLAALVVDHVTVEPVVRSGISPHTRKADLPSPVRFQRVEIIGPGTELLAIMADKNIPSCQSCKSLAALMDEWGPLLCLERIESIVGDPLAGGESFYDRVKRWVDREVHWIPTFLADTKLEETAIKVRIKSHIKRACRQAIAKEAERAARAARKAEATRQRLQVVAEPGRRSGTMPLMPSQRRLHAACLASPQPRPNPYAGKPIRNMIWHIWPVEGWRRHVERIHDLAATCDGERIIGLSISLDSESADDVRQELGDGFTYLEFENKGEGDGSGSGEVQTLRSALPLLDATDPDSVTVYGHCKGVRAHTRTSEAVQLWCDLMWEMVALNHDQADEAMESGYQLFGAFRTFGGMPLSPTHSWHYSGTFFQFRTSAILADGIPPVKGGYGGTEAWPGDCVTPQDAACVFGDGLPFKAAYDLKNWPGWIDQAFEWEVSRIGGPRTEQHQRELNWLLDRLHGTRELLVIGSKHGGLEYHIGQRYPDMRIVSVDIAAQADNAAPEVIAGSSADPIIQRRLREDYEFDAVFIDGDHTLEGVTADWEFAKTLSPNTIYFHDVADVLKHRLEDCHAHTLWAQIKKTHITDEKIVGCGWGGIGEVKWRL